MKMVNHPNRRVETKMSFDGTDLFVVRDGVKIAKRGKLGTKYAKTWISLEPGFVVRSPDDHSTIEIEYNGVRIQ